MRLSRRLALIVAVAPVTMAVPARADTAKDYGATARLLTTAEPRCRAAVTGNDIIVCGRRDADRYRVPFDGYPDGDPRNETVSGERNRLATAPQPACGLAWNQSTCGGVGMSVTVGFGGGLREQLKVRPLAK